MGVKKGGNRRPQRGSMCIALLFLESLEKGG
jgi:hypothetical protein